MASEDLMLAGMLALAAMSAAAVVYLLLAPYLSGEARTSKRIHAATENKGRRIAIKQQAEVANSRRRQVADTLKELEHRQKQREKISMRLRLQRAGLDTEPRVFWIASLVCGALVGAVIWLTAPNLPIVVPVLGAFVGTLGLPRWILARLTRRRQFKFIDEFANAIDVIGDCGNPQQPAAAPPLFPNAFNCDLTDQDIDFFVDLYFESDGDVMAPLNITHFVSNGVEYVTIRNQTAAQITLTNFKLGDEEQPPWLAPRAQRVDRSGRLVREHDAPDVDPCLEVGVRLGRPNLDVRHPDRFNLPCRFAYCSPRRNTQSPSGIETMPMRISGQISSHIESRPAPSRMASRAPSSAYVAGEITAIHCIHVGRTSTG